MHINSILTVTIWIDHLPAQDWQWRQIFYQSQRRSQTGCAWGRWNEF